MRAFTRAVAFAFASGLALGALAWGIGSTYGTLAGLDVSPGRPELRTLALTWERTYCPGCEAPPEPSASEARGRARPPR